MKDIISKLMGGEDLSSEETLSAMRGIMSGEATPAQIAGFLVALRLKGETVDEITACARVMREMASGVQAPPGSVDTCGTGGDGTNTFNISTVSAFVVAAAGVPVAKHGNRGVSSRSGSADLLEALGVDITLPADLVARAVREVGIGFMFAPVFHQAMKHAIGPRRELGVRTVFNVLGPLTNPAGVTNQVIGVYDPELTAKLANVLRNLGSTHVLVVNGSRLDEFTTTGETTVSELRDGVVTTYNVTPEQYGIPRATIEDIRGGTPEENVSIARSVLSGEKGPRLDIVILNAGAAIYAADRATSILDGVTMARDVIVSGKALEKLEALITFTTTHGSSNQQGSETT